MNNTNELFFADAFGAERDFFQAKWHGKTVHMEPTRRGSPFVWIAVVVLPWLLAEGVLWVLRYVTVHHPAQAGGINYGMMAPVLRVSAACLMAFCLYL
ncbi:MAG TPA: hypothetical protein VG797_06710 [Phycisphaerales bacterium]|nr:hypothetical protein [Phycisphaerales bacterium]